MEAANESKRFQGWANEDLLRASGPEREEYRPEAIIQIEAELARRGVRGAERDNLAYSMAVEEGRRRRELTGVRGWLLLFALIVLGNSLSRVLGGARQALQDPFSAVLALPGFAVGAYGCYVFGLLLTKRRSAPQHATRWLVVGFGVSVFYLILTRGFTGGVIFAGFAGLGCSIWVEYLRKSIRVAATYGPLAQDVEPAGGTDG